MPVPVEPKIYHIVHLDRLPSIVADGGLLCDADVASHASDGTTIGMNDIKERRRQLRLTSRRDLRVECVPFYFCPRSVMLYVIREANHPKLTYRGGQNPIVHLEADLRRTVTWAEDRSYAGRLPSRTPVPTTSRIGVTCANWIRSIGML